MGIEVLSQPCQPGQTLQFTFQNALQNWVVGLGYFSLSYATGSNHWVETLSISLQTNLPAPAAASNVLEVIVQAQLMDHSGHTVDATASRIWVVCVAVTGSSDSNTVLANVTGVTPRQPQEVQLPGAQAGSYTVLTTCLSGLDLSYDTTDHMFQGATGGCGINPQASGEGLLNATANIWDSSGNQAVTASIDAGVLATVDNPSPFMVQQVNAYNGANVPALTFPSAVERAVAMIQSFNVQYASGDHGVAVITVGCPNLSSSGSTVNLGAVATTTDDDGNDSNDGLSYVNLLVVAVPQSSSTAGRP